MPYRIVLFHTGRHIPHYTACWPRHKGVNNLRKVITQQCPTDRESNPPRQTSMILPQFACARPSSSFAFPVALNSLQSAFSRGIYARAMGISTSWLFRRRSSTVQSLRNADCDYAPVFVVAGTDSTQCDRCRLVNS